MSANRELDPRALETMVHDLARSLDDARAPGADVAGDVEQLRRVATEAAAGTTLAAEVERFCAVEKAFSSAEHAAFELTRILDELRARERILERRDRFVAEGMAEGTQGGTGPAICLSFGPEVCLSIVRVTPERPKPKKVSALVTIALTVAVILILATILYYLR